MKKIKFFLMAFVAMTLTAGIASCGDDNDNVTPNVTSKTDTVYVDKPVDGSNWNRYQQLVTADVKAKKQNSKAILLVAFGSTWEQAFAAFDSTVVAYNKDSRFDGYDVFLSFSSAICINRAAAGENVDPRNFYAPPFWLNAFAAEGVRYEEIVVQSLQVIPGEEYTRVINYIKDFANNANGDLDDEYLANVTLKLGVPLLQDKDTDVPEVAKRLDALYSDKAASDIVAFMGHGNPDSYDTYKANQRYDDLEKELQTNYSPNYFVGTVDMMKNFKTHVYERMKPLANTGKKVYLHPLMSIDGDHGHNDMAGDDLPKGVDEDNYTFDQLQALANEEGEVEYTSWKRYFGANGSGFTCNDETMINLGLLELETIRDVWMQHTDDAIKGEPLDFYHSMYPEAE